MIDPMKRFYGWLPSYPDPNAILAELGGVTILDEVDPRNVMQDPYDQYRLGSCTANAAAGGIEYDNILDGVSYGTPSRLFLYWNTRKIEGTINTDSGATGHDDFRVARHIGVPPETLCPYEIANFRQEPSQAAFDAASRYKIGKYVHPGYPYSRSVEDRVQGFKELLSNKQTIAVGFTVFESFESQQVASTGIVPMPKPGEQAVGGHEVLIIGYLSAYPDHALVRNSWGTQWGLEGYCLIPWEIVASPKYSGDWRSIYRPASSEGVNE